MKAGASILARPLRDQTADAVATAIQRQNVVR
jgi:hypothetical protein